VRVGDLGTPLEAQATEFEHIFRTLGSFTNSRQTDRSIQKLPVRKMSKPLWNRGKHHTRRRYFDIACLLVVTIQEWRKTPLGEGFKHSAQDLLRAMCSAEMRHERIYLTLFWILCSSYWRELSTFVLSTNMLYLDDEAWCLAYKEITDQVRRTWVFPGTNIQSIFSAYFINAEDLVGYPDSNPCAGAISLDILEVAAGNLDHSIPCSEDCTFEAYLRQVSAAAESLLEPIYKHFPDKALMYKEALIFVLRSRPPVCRPADPCRRPVWLINCRTRLRSRHSTTAPRCRTQDRHNPKSGND
jgi:hypothetical protein